MNESQSSRYQRIRGAFDKRLNPGPDDSKLVDTLIITLISFNVLSVMMETDKAIAAAYGTFFLVFETFSTIVFTAEYLLRIWLAPLHAPEHTPSKARIRWAAGPMAIIDIVAIAPFYLQFLAINADARIARAIRMFRLLRIMKIGRYAYAVRTLSQVFARKKEELAIVTFVMAMLLILCSSAIYFVEHGAQPEAFPNIPQSMWWTVVTITSVGYGDVAPISGMGQFVGGIICLIGVLFVALPTGILSAGFLEQMREDKRGSDADTFGYCPHCGEQLIPGEVLD